MQLVNSHTFCSRQLLAKQLGEVELKSVRTGNPEPQGPEASCIVAWQCQLHSGTFHPALFPWGSGA